jgi:hypothetical protein
MQQQQPVSEQPAAKKQHTDSRPEDLQQQQQGIAGSSTPLTLPELKRLLQQQVSSAHFTNYCVTLNHWSKACSNSTEIKTLLHNIDALVQRLTAVDAAGKAVYSRKTAGIYLYCASGLLKLPEVQQLLDVEGSEKIRRCVKDAQAVLQARAAAEAADQAAGNAAAASAAAVPAQSQQQQQQREEGEAVPGSEQGTTTAAAVDNPAAAVDNPAAAAAAPCAHCGAGAAVAAVAAGAGAGVAVSGSKRSAEQQVRPLMTMLLLAQQSTLPWCFRGKLILLVHVRTVILLATDVQLR